MDTTILFSYAGIVFFQAGMLIAAAPLVRMTIKKIKARLQNRVGPPLLQGYYDAFKLFRKESVISEHTSFIFRIAPWIIFGAAAGVALFVPVLFSFSPLGSAADIILIIYLFALATFFMVLAGLDAGSAFGGMGSSREVMIYSLSEPAMMLAIFAVARAGGSTNLSNIISHGLAEPGSLFLLSNIFAFAAFFIVLLAENKRIPVDNPATHLELTMVHEAMILEYSGRQLALIEWAAALKLTIFLVLLVNIFFPFGLMAEFTFSSAMLAIFLLVVKVSIAVCVIAFIENSIAKLRLFRLPDFLGIAFVLALIALISSFFV
ncbi:NADH-quinone oxidoreductase subunit H [Candidatus Azambacteria bacterium]|nr:NADH-quinone oxidoreductase subunit H [Candidatus Azambacteria bacterium]